MASELYTTRSRKDIHGKGLELTGTKNIDEQTKDAILAVFNCFDTGFKDQKGTFDIVLPPLSGRLHETFILRDRTVIDRKRNGRKYVVQKLSLTPFDLKAVEHMLQVLEIAQGHAESKGAFDKGGILEGWNKVKYYNVKGGVTKNNPGTQIGQKILYEYDKQGNPFAAWRVMKFVGGEIYDKLEDIGVKIEDTKCRRRSLLKAAELLGEALARFVILMNFVPEDAQFIDTLPGFHNTQGYIDEVNDLLAGKKVPVRPGKSIIIAKMVDGLFSEGHKNGKYTVRIGRMIEIFRSTCFLADAFKGLPPSLQRVVAHGDPKVNNVIWATDETGSPHHVKCFIDMDTIGIYTALDDFGDASRSIINVFGENIWKEEKTLDEIMLDKEVLEKLVKGYLKGIKSIYYDLNLEELKVYLYRAVAVYFFQLGTRFLKAFISELDRPADGDGKQHFVYFVKQSEEVEDANLRRAEIQYTALVRFLKESREELKLDELDIKVNGLRDPIGWQTHA
jgi:hypothetical protein